MIQDGQSYGNCYISINLQDHSDKPMSGAGSLVDLDQQIISNTRCRRQT